MSHFLVPQLIDLLREYSAVDLKSSTNFKFMVSLRDKLIFCGFPKDDAEKIVGAMEIEVTDGLIEDHDLETLAVLYCQLLEKAHQALIDANFEFPIYVLVKMAERFSLKLK